MKLALRSAVLCLLLNAYVSAASVSVSNYNGVDVFALVGTSNKVLVTTGTITIGTFTSDPVEALASYDGMFTAFGSPFEFFGAGAPGFFTESVSQSIAQNSFFDGKTVYAVIRSGNEVAVWKATSNPDGNTFLWDNPTGGPNTLQVLTTTGTLLIGSIDAYAVPSFGTQNGFTLAAIPEPTSSLLAMLGGLTLVFRRRRMA